MARLPISLKLILLIAVQLPASLGTTDSTWPHSLRSCPPIQKLQALPGYGWDNLQNKEMRPVILQTFQQCRMTLDGKYCLPDGTFDQPVRSSNVEIVSELIEHWRNYTDVTAHSMGVSASLYIDTVRFGAGGISGSFTDNYRSTKRQQYDDKAITTRTEARYVQYTIGTDSNYRLDPEFEKRLRVIVHHIEAGGRNDTIRLLAQLLVRDYGTHLITRVDVGGVMVKEDMISALFLNTLEETERSKLIRGSASYSFFIFFQAGAEYEQVSSDVQKLSDQYINSRSSSTIHSYGGIFYKPELCSNESNCLARWVESVPGNLVTVDRSGDPLHFAIQPSTLENVSADTLQRLSQEVAGALRDYYNQNTHRGCLDVGSPAFEYYANMDDNSCQNTTYNFTFGGLYQNCTSSVVNPDAGDICPNFQLVNPVTGQYSCPPKYTSTILRRNSVSRDGCHEECHGWWFWKHCDSVCGTSLSTYKTYWCAAIESQAHSNGVFFGGLYTSTTDNLLTNAKSCPPTFQPFKMLTDLMLCLSVDVEYGTRFAIPFGGFFSCEYGNPLYSQMQSLGSAFHMGAGTGEHNDPIFAQACPPGFSQHMAVIDNNCYVYYCVKANSFGTHGDTVVQLPPYVPYDAIFAQTALQELLSNETHGKASSSGFSAGTVAGIAIAAVAALVLIAILGVVGLKKYRSRRNLVNLGNNAEAAGGGGNDEMQRGLLEDNDHDGGIQ